MHAKFPTANVTDYYKFNDLNLNLCHTEPAFRTQKWVSLYDTQGVNVLCAF